MGVLALVAALSFRGLGSVLDAQARVSAETQRWSDAAVLMAQLGQDLSLAIPRPARDGSGRVRPALMLHGAAGSTQGAEAQLVIARLGDGEDAPSRSGPRRVGYRLRGDAIEYLVWPGVDAAPATGPSAHPVLEGVSALELSALDHQGAWTSAWPGGEGTGILPRAVAVQIGFSGGERIRRVFLVR